MKFLNLQTLLQGYLCLGHTNHHHHHQLSSDELRLVDSKPVVKVIKSDGVVDIYRRPITASELMLQFPKHLVCDSQSFYIGQKIPPLSPSDKLKLGHNYFLLPLQFFESVLSFVTMASSFASLNNSNTTTTTSLMSKAALSSCQVFDIRKAPSGYLQIRVSDEFVSKLMQQEKKISKSSPICTTTELQKDYTQLVSVRQWKPKLETIRESKRKRLSSSSFGIKRKKKAQSKVIKQQQHHKGSTSTATPSQKLKKGPKIKKIKAKKIKGL
ncbi:hypothetical protein ACHQM5_007775 [Ranunculus cassubicifolius]